MHSEFRIKNGYLEHRKFWTTERISRARSLMQRERRYLGIQVKYLGHPSDELLAIVLGNLSTLQELDAARLAKFGTTVAVVSWIRNLDPDLANQQPRGWAEDKTWNDADGIYRRAFKTAAVAENTNDGKSVRSVFVLWHELGHAIDHAIGDYSHSDAFKSAYADDVSRFNADQRKKQSYFLQEGEAGQEEAFAEIYAALNTAEPGKTHEILQLFPQSMLQIIGRLSKPD